MAATEYALGLEEGMGVEEGGRMVEGIGARIYSVYSTLPTPPYPPLPAIPSRNAERDPTAPNSFERQEHRPQLRPTAPEPTHMLYLWRRL
ncbi:hypothetical protein VNI00_012918 [Paramarasmius palmivorus]|uniref:Uncharacterized protein n=1 Tax=Paramarasmius palmivorus TaxID=297713 RepID=A0AAW0C0C5_9AGAR